MPKSMNEISKFKEISISEFFEKNKHILGFDSQQKSLFMIIKEAIDNSLDACEEHSIVPEVTVRVEREDSDEFLLSVEDNGPGLDRKEIPKVFGQLLYGSRFHSFRQSRGQQGIGITAAILYGQITTGRSSYIKSKQKGQDVAYEVELGINIKENRGNLISEKPVIWEVEHGTMIVIHAKGKYQTGRQSILEYLRETAVVNPNMTLTFIDPDNKKHIFRRAIDEPSKPARPIKPHPLGLELGEINDLASGTEAKNIEDFLTREFNRVSKNVAGQILEVSGLVADKPPVELKLEEIKKLKASFEKVKLMPPPVDCLSPLGQEFIRKGLMNVYEENQPSFYSKPVSRPVSVYSGNPFSVEVGLVYGGRIKGDEPVRIVRYANKVPLLYQAGACAITKAVSEIDWRNYGLEQRQGSGVPYGPAIIMVHVYGTRIPYTSESKEAIANVPEIMDEVKQALRVIGRSIRRYMRKKSRREKANEKFRLVRTLIPEIGNMASNILGEDAPNLDSVISKIANVVFINEDMEKEGEKLKITVNIFNYTSSSRSFKLYADPPVGDISDGVNTWQISELEPAQGTTVEFQITGKTADYSGTDYYFTGIDSVYIQGADPLPGDWNLESLEYEEEEEVEDD